MIYLFRFIIISKDFFLCSNKLTENYKRKFWLSSKFWIHIDLKITFSLNQLLNLNLKLKQKFFVCLQIANNVVYRYHIQCTEIDKFNRHVFVICCFNLDHLFINYFYSFFPLWGFFLIYIFFNFFFFLGGGGNT